MEDIDLFREELKTWKSVTSNVVRGSPNSSITINSPQVPPMVLDILLDTKDVATNRALALSGHRVLPHRKDSIGKVYFKPFTPSTGIW